MYDLSHDLIGALSPVLVMLATMMIAGGSGGGSSYAFATGLTRRGRAALP